MRRMLVIGIGAGDPDQVTLQAVKTLNEVDVFFVIGKGEVKEDLVRLRREICERHIEGRDYRIVDVEDPERDRTAPDYPEAVEAWREARSRRVEQSMLDELGDAGTGAILVWGDPALYDGTIVLLDRIRARGAVEFEYEVIPGVSSVAALAARHRVPLNRVGGAIQLTTGRRLAAGFPAESDDVVVMLDSDCAFRHLDSDGLDIDIYWGAYVGTPDEILISGPLAEVGAEIEAARAVARRRKGWIMDTYLLKRR